MFLRASEKVTRGVRESAKAADRFASCREERLRAERGGLREDLQRRDTGASGGFLELEEGQQTVKRGETQESPGSFQLEGSLSGAFSGPYTCCSRSP